MTSRTMGLPERSRQFDVAGQRIAAVRRSSKIIRPPIRVFDDVTLLRKLQAALNSLSPSSIRIPRRVFGVLLPLLLCLPAGAGELEVDLGPGGPVASYAAERLTRAFAENPEFPDAGVRFDLQEDLGTEAYQIEVTRSGDGLGVQITGGDASGQLYGALTLIEQLRAGGETVKDTSGSARFPFRAIKFNLPWVSYRAGDAIEVHRETCRDLRFWEAFLDMMADNRFNALTLWSLHPFHLMIRNSEYPEACDLTDEELTEWQTFWRSLFAMARERGIETYLVNWNVYTSPAFAEYHGLAEYLLKPSYDINGPGEKAEVVKDYLRTTVTQVIDEYPDLTGLGVSLGERMANFNPAEREQWIQDTFVAGMQDASRPIRFIHRLPFSRGSEESGAPGLTTEELTREAIESLDLPTTVITEAKFNWSHGHSTPKLIKIHGGEMGDTYWNPPPQNYQIHWMMRNEDFFALRWAEPNFVRRHIALNGPDYVGGYYVGSECYIPATDYLTAPEYVTGYAFERQWLFYLIWGRLLHNPDLPANFFREACRKRFGEDGVKMYDALRLGSRMPLRLASFFNATWDFTLYSEGFQSLQARDNPDRLITVDTLIARRPMDPELQSIRDFVQQLRTDGVPPPGVISPLELAARSVADGQAALAILDSVPGEVPTDLMLELSDARAWAHLSVYFGEKLRAAVALHHFREGGDPGQGRRAVAHLENAREQWAALVRVTEPVYAEMPITQIFQLLEEKPDPRRFHWKLLLPAVTAELERVKTEVAGAL